MNSEKCSCSSSAPAADNCQEFGKKALRIHPSDSVAVALVPLAKGETITVEASGNAKEVTLTLKEDIMAGHKFAIKDIKSEEPVIKYGYRWSKM